MGWTSSKISWLPLSFEFPCKALALQLFSLSAKWSEGCHPRNYRLPATTLYLTYGSWCAFQSPFSLHKPHLDRQGRWTLKHVVGFPFFILDQFWAFVMFLKFGVLRWGLPRKPTSRELWLTAWLWPNPRRSGLLEADQSTTQDLANGFQLLIFLEYSIPKINLWSSQSIKGGAHSWNLSSCLSWVPISLSLCSLLQPELPWWSASQQPSSVSPFAQSASAWTFTYRDSRLCPYRRWWKQE